MQTPDGTIPVVSQNSLVKAVADGALMLDRAGGTLSVVLQRHATGFPNEMVTVGAVIEWRDRTDARPQPEVARETFVLPAEDGGVDGVVGALHGEVLSAEQQQGADEPPPGDGTVEVDERDVPAELRG